MKNLLAWFKDEEGQGMVEYALIVGLISIVAITILVTVGGRIRDKFHKVDDALQTEPPPYEG